MAQLWTPGGDDGRDKQAQFREEVRQDLLVHVQPLGVTALDWDWDQRSDRFVFHVEVQGWKYSFYISGYVFATTVNYLMFRDLVLQEVGQVVKTHEGNLKDLQETARKEWEDKAPDLTQWLIGFRSWILKYEEGEFWLDPLFSSRGRERSPWKGGELVKSRCARHDPNMVGRPGGGSLSPHEAPHQDCDCGLYCWSDLNDVLGQEGIHGIVAAKGRVLVHREGFRAEYMKPVAFINLVPYGVPSGDIARASKEFNVPVVSKDHAMEFAQEYGTVVPESLKPTDEDPYEEYPF